MRISWGFLDFISSWEVPGVGQKMVSDTRKRRRMVFIASANPKGRYGPKSPYTQQMEIKGDRKLDKKTGKERKVDKIRRKKQRRKHFMQVENFVFPLDR